MNRKAILIESSKIKNHSDLPGARLDIKNWETYLKTDLGGAWTDSEIIKLSHPFTTDVEREIAATISFDYVFVVFSGHGCEGSVVLNDYVTSHEIAKIKPRSAKGTIIIDSCRGVTDEPAYEVRAKRALANESRDTAFALNSLLGKATELSEASYRESPVRHRLAWKNSLTSSSRGVVEMLSCSKGESANEDPAAGGFYTSLLLQGSMIWEHSNAGTIFTTKEAHDYAKTMLPPQQTPEYRPVTLAFPFGVNA